MAATTPDREKQKTARMVLLKLTDLMMLRFPEIKLTVELAQELTKFLLLEKGFSELAARWYPGLAFDTLTFDGFLMVDHTGRVRTTPPYLTRSHKSRFIGKQDAISMLEMADR